METKKSTHRAEVVPITLQPHDNADTLSIIPVFGYTVCGRTAEWKDRALGLYINPDSLVDTDRPEFSFLKGEAKFNADCTKGGAYARIRAKKLRGVVSYGLLIPAPEGAQPGEDWSERLGVLRYEPPEKVNTKGETSSGPNLYYVKYDVDGFQRYAQEVFSPGEPVFVTEKIHGCNGRWVYHNGEFYCGSRTEWKKEFSTPPNPEVIENNIRAKSKLTGEDLEEYINNIKEKILRAKPEQNLWWRALRSTPVLEEWLKQHPDVIVYGEVYGAVQNMRYGTKGDEIRIGVFDLLDNGKWIDPHAARLAAPALPWVPVVKWNMKYNFDEVLKLAEGQSLIPGANHIKEGAVVKPLHERTHRAVGRVQLKVINPAYLEKDYD